MRGPSGENGELSAPGRRGRWRGAVNARIADVEDNRHLEVRPAQRPLRVPPFRLFFSGTTSTPSTTRDEAHDGPSRGRRRPERRSRVDAALRLQGRRGGVGERFKTTPVYLYDIICSL